MKFITRSPNLAKLTEDAIIVGAFSNDKGPDKGPPTLSPSAEQLHAQGLLADTLALGDFTGQLGKLAIIALSKGKGRLVLVGLGAAAKLDIKAYKKATQAALTAVAATQATNVVFTLHELPVSGLDNATKSRIATVAAHEACYRFDLTKSKKDPLPKLHSIAFTADAAASKDTLRGAEQGDAIGEGASFAKTLGNLPPNVCTPSYLAAEAKKLARTYKLGVEVLDKKQCEALKMGSFLAVAQGSLQAPKFIILKYSGAGKSDAPVVLVGKGITFDSGGISLKPGESMDEMKYDMCGAASVLGTFRAIAQLKPKLNLVGIIPACENMPSGSAIKPGDIVTSLSGLTVEILNTDAEGRLILNDALTYARRFKPAAVVDIATLTGACMIALGGVHSGLFSKSDALATELLQAGADATDTAWRMPLDDEYQEGLKSNFADMPNIATRAGGAVTAACFLSRYTEGLEWAHLDIAGTAWKQGPAKGATGRPVGLLTQFLLSRSGK